MYAVVGLVGVLAAATAGALVANQPVLVAGVVFVALVVLARSREATVTLWLGIRVLMFSGYVALALGETMLVLITVVALVRWMISGRRVRAPRSPLLWLLLLGLVALNVAYFGFVPESRDYVVVVIVENFLLVTLIANTESRWGREGAVTAVALILLGIGSVAALESVTGAPLVSNSARIAYGQLAALQTFEGTNRPGSVLLNPDYLGTAMVLGFVVWTGIALERRGLRRWVAALFAAGFLLVALTTLSRSVFVGAPVGLAALLVFALVNGRASIARAAVAVAAFSAAGLAALSLVPNAWLRITTDPVDPLRLGAYRTALQIIVAHPLAGLGAGWNRYLALAEPYRVIEQYRPLAHPHNSYLELATMLGLPVAILVALMIGGALVRGFSNRVSPTASAIPIAGVAALMVMALLGQTITIPVLASLFWALWAVAERAPQKRDKLSVSVQQPPYRASGTA